MRIFFLRSPGEGKGCPVPSCEATCHRDRSYSMGRAYWRGWKRTCGTRDRQTGNASSGCLSSRSPKVSSQYRAILYCCGFLQETRGGYDIISVRPGPAQHITADRADSYDTILKNQKLWETEQSHPNNIITMIETNKRICCIQKQINGLYTEHHIRAVVFERQNHRVLRRHKSRFFNGLNYILK